LEINERGTFVDPATLSGDDPVSKAKLLAQEEAIFQTARLINCGWFGMGTIYISQKFLCFDSLAQLFSQIISPQF
jgi:hypothetical protein